MMLPLKYAANKHMRRACAKTPCLISPPGCCVVRGVSFSVVSAASAGEVASVGAGAFWVRCAFSFSITGMVGGGCRCLMPSVVIVSVVGAYVEVFRRLGIPGVRVHA
jgi:hypothetical protein